MVMYSLVLTISSETDFLGLIENTVGWILLLLPWVLFRNSFRLLKTGGVLSS